VSLLVGLSHGEDVEPDRVTWIDAGWLQVTWHDDDGGPERRRFYPPHRVDFVERTWEEQ
jgi:hypothetical protein